MIREDILQQFPELFGTKKVNGREVNVEETIATLTRELRPAIADGPERPPRAARDRPRRCARSTPGRSGTRPSTIRSPASRGPSARSSRA